MVAHRNNSLEGSVQLVDVGEHMLKALPNRQSRHMPTEPGAYHGNLADEGLSLLLKVRLFMSAHCGGRPRIGSHRQSRR